MSDKLNSFKSMKELDKWIKKEFAGNKTAAMKSEGYTRQQYYRMEKDFEKKAKKKPPKTTKKPGKAKASKKSKAVETELLQINWKDLETFIIHKKVEQQMTFGSVEEEIERWIKNVLANKKQYRIAKDTFNFINEYLRKENIEVIKNE